MVVIMGKHVVNQGCCGVLFLDKPLGWSSRKAVNAVMRLLRKDGEKRVKAGHAGTLDPLATGMLPVLVGDATRYADTGLSAEKSYRVTFDLSFQSDTLDGEGDITGHFDGAVSRERLELVLANFRGEIEQVPPAFSAIHVDGKRAHEMARKGETVVLKPRQVCINSLHLLAFEYPLVTLEVHCSKGTYIRSLARDIGEALAMGGCVTALRRISTGGWPEVMMVSLDELEEKREACLLPLQQWLRHYQQLSLDGDDVKRFLHGQRIQLKEEVTAHIEKDAVDEVVVNSVDGVMLGTATLKPGMRVMVLHPKKILPSSQHHYLT